MSIEYLPHQLIRLSRVEILIALIPTSMSESSLACYAVIIEVYPYLEFDIEQEEIHKASFIIKARN